MNNLKFKKIALSLLIFMSLILTGCASSLTGDTYSRDEARRSQTVSKGVITDIRMVTVEGTDSNVGKIGGAVIGGAIGSRVNHGSGVWAVIGGTIGAMAGGVAGTQAEERVTRIQAYEMTIKEDNGRVRAIVQEVGKNESFNIGDHVNIITNSSGTARVSH